MSEDSAYLINRIMDRSNLELSAMQSNRIPTDNELIFQCIICTSWSFPEKMFLFQVEELLDGSEEVDEEDVDIIGLGEMRNPSKVYVQQLSSILETGLDKIFDRTGKKPVYLQCSVCCRSFTGADPYKVIPNEIDISLDPEEICH